MQEFDWNDFVETLFRMPPQDPFTFDIFIDTPQVSMEQLLLYGISRGSVILFNLSFLKMNEQQITLMTQYMLGGYIMTKSQQIVYYQHGQLYILT